MKIVLRADSGFCREELMARCEENKVDYLFGLARNKRLQKILGKPMHEARMEHEKTKKAARVFTEFQYKTRKSWARERRVAGKAEYLDKGPNPRFVVTSLGAERWAAKDLYEKFYCARGEMENRIKEQMSLFAYRLSTEEMKGNQLRLYLSALSYTLVGRSAGSRSRVPNGPRRRSIRYGESCSRSARGSASPPAACCSNSAQPMPGSISTHRP